MAKTKKTNLVNNSIQNSWPGWDKWVGAYWYGENSKKKEDVIEKIKNEGPLNDALKKANNIVNTDMNQLINNDDEAIFSTQYKELIELELSFYKQLIGDQDSDKDNYLNKDDGDKIDFWTRYFFLGEKDSKNENKSDLSSIVEQPIISFKILISSEEFLNLMSSQKIDLHLTSFIQENSGERPTEQDKKNVVKDIIEEGSIQTVLETPAKEYFEETINKYFEQLLSEKQIDPKTISKFKITSKAESRSMREEKQDIKKQLSDYIQVLKKDKRIQFQEESLRITTQQGKLMINMPIDVVGGLYEQEIESEHKKNSANSNDTYTEDDYINGFKNATNKALIQLQEKDGSVILTVMNLGKLYISKEQYKDFINAINKFLNSDSFDDQIKNAIVYSEETEIKGVAKSNFVGNMGEIVGYLNNYYAGLDPQITGKIFDTGQVFNEKTSFGESTSDVLATIKITGQKDGNNQIGINIKNYTSKIGSTKFKIYDDSSDPKKQNGINLGKQYIFKYLPQDTVLFLRYYDINNKNEFLTPKASLENRQKLISLVSTMNYFNFIRGHAAIEPEISKNLFYQINNYIIPISVILKQLDKGIYEIFKKGTTDSELFKIISPTDQSDAIINEKNPNIMNRTLDQKILNDQLHFSSVLFNGFTIDLSSTRLIFK